MRKTFIFILISIFIFSCSNKAQNTIENLWDNYSFNATISSSTQIVIRAYDSTLVNKRAYLESYNSIKEFKITKQQIKDFNKIFINAEKTTYCCCPQTSYSIHFLNQKEELDFFYVDILEFKNKVRICEKSYQYSYIIEKQKWKSFLHEIDKK